ncbi:MAG: deoxyribose-phosphate aldolase [Candidatus Parvarchaeota archaeon]|nr:deoxyribose-phosphate aldolase [Candidatus Jingweiarchaeum tengchongense]MCW1298671.1 deoxyribose-phosphate aldolase [Candidatus Jingweiarchaeum tengchongense]MCW1300513.1 deoxyribose-phosphate aldolase [Candidatus Jingweiarchaeum tengchongense]MCW1304672.1 deoxyribose-phosphate aldolase [Candidatus Jingweiarchaeum tengchongense]MCW1305861.1 deoxyribose-phosphate aldolase [Candidatus Jingweiarchaeum tengchongense]
MNLEEITEEKIAKMIDHTLLKPYATEKDIEKVCLEAKKYGFASVCVNPSYVSLASNLLKGSNVKVCTVIGFPLGANKTETKCLEAKLAIEDGASEIDMVINIGEMKNGNYSYVEDEIRKIVEIARSKGVISKVIVETCYLNEEEKRIACELAKRAGADFVKTSTGFGTKGADVNDVKLMREVVGSAMGIKASGGIKTIEQVIEMIKAGATRIGASASVEIIEDLRRRK